jgi:hypothetical protein
MSLLLQLHFPGEKLEALLSYRVSYFPGIEGHVQTFTKKEGCIYFRFNNTVSCSESSTSKNRMIGEDRIRRIVKERAHYRGLCLEGLRKNKKTLSEESRSADRDLSSGLPEYRAVVPLG